MLELLLELFAVALANAAANADDALVAVCRSYVLQRGDLAHQALVCLLSYAACEEDRDVGLLKRAHGERSGHLEHAGDALCVVLVHLASEGPLPVGLSSEGVLPGCISNIHNNVNPICHRRVKTE